MQVTVEVLNNLERKLLVKVPPADVNQEVDKRLKEMTNSKIKGFRQGKVPVEFLRKQYGKAVRQEVIWGALETSYRKAVEQENLKPAGPAQLNLLNSDFSDGAFEFEAKFEVLPTVDIKNLEHLEVEKPIIEITEEQVDETLALIRKQNTEWIKADKSAEKGDRVFISYQGFKEGELFKGGSADKVNLDLGTNMTIPGFEEGLIGAKAGDNVTLNLTFPSAYHMKDLASQSAEFKVTVHEVLTAKLPEFDETFFKKFGIHEGGVPELRQKIRGIMEKEVNTRVHNHLKDQIVKELLGAHPIELPDFLIKEEIKGIQQQEKMYLAQAGIKSNLPEKEPSEGMLKLAKDRVHLGLFLGEYIRLHNIQLDTSRLSAKLEEIASRYPNPEAILGSYAKDKLAMSQLENIVLEDQVVDELLKQVQVKEIQMSYNDFKNLKLEEEKNNDITA